MKRLGKKRGRKRKVIVKINGRPPRYATEQGMIDKINEYFNYCVEIKKLPSKAGLFVYLEIDRSTYSDYKKKFPNAVTKANLFIEEAWVTRLSKSQAGGAIFYLKNAFKENYADRHETDLRVKELPKPLLGGDSKKHGAIQKNNSNGENPPVIKKD
jgi:hypothetical protein